MNTCIFPKGERASSDYFTGTAWVNILVPKDETGTYSIGNVVFEPGSRNNWHTQSIAAFVASIIEHPD